MNGENQITHSLSVYSLVQQVVAAQKSMRRSASMLITFVFICTILYMPITGITDIQLDNFLGAKVNAQKETIRLLATVILGYYIIIFGTNYYKGLELIEEADRNIRNNTSMMNNESRINYIASLSDNYLFDAMRRVFGSQNGNISLLNNNKKEGSDYQSDNPANINLTDLYRFADNFIRNSVAYLVVVIFIVLVLYAEYLTLIGITSISGNFIGDNNENIDLSRSGWWVIWIASAVYAILSYLFFSYLSKAFKEREKHRRKQIMAVLAVIFLFAQFFLMPGFAYNNEENLVALNQGCRIGEKQMLKKGSNSSSLNRQINSPVFVCVHRTE